MFPPRGGAGELEACGGGARGSLHVPPSFSVARTRSPARGRQALGRQPGTRPGRGYPLRPGPRLARVWIRAVYPAGHRPAHGQGAARGVSGIRPRAGVGIPVGIRVLGYCRASGPGRGRSRDARHGPFGTGARGFRRGGGGGRTGRNGLGRRWPEAAAGIGAHRRRAGARGPAARPGADRSRGWPGRGEPVRLSRAATARRGRRAGILRRRRRAAGPDRPHAADLVGWRRPAGRGTGGYLGVGSAPGCWARACCSAPGRCQ